MLELRIVTQNQIRIVNHFAILIAAAKPETCVLTSVPRLFKPLLSPDGFLTVFFGSGAKA
jgi:hypothetical protein